jgi:hypothetical protein
MSRWSRGGLTRGTVVLVLLAVALAASPGSAATVTGDVEGLRFEVTSQPEVPRVGERIVYTARLTAADGRPVAGARVLLVGRMPDGMRVTVPLRPDAEPGTYRGPVLFIMGGAWELTVQVTREGRQVELAFEEQVQP